MYQYYVRVQLQNLAGFLKNKSTFKQLSTLKYMLMSSHVPPASTPLQCYC
jgi:hypothetical protein